ncbi:MAG: HD domain-containing protein [Spirochaetes bacterium]|nr:HD domain-containing protein [Spirochaetota bacterium]
MDLNRNLLLSQCLEALGLVLEYDLNDHPSHQHAVRVGESCALIAEKLGLPPERIQQIYYAGLIHDIGKISIDINILRQKRKLTADEFTHVKKHSVTGSRIAAALPELSDLSFWIRWHHEKWDGTGYPDGLAGVQIPVEVQIMSAVDCFDSLQTPRLDRDKITAAEAEEVIKQQRGTAFNPVIVDIISQMIADGEITPGKSSDKFIELKKKHLNRIYRQSTDNYWSGIGMTGMYPILRLFARVIDAKHEYTQGHSTRVSILSRYIAQKAGFSVDDIIKVEIAGLLHDAGKISIPHEVLDKKNIPDNTEWEIIRNHPVHSCNILSNIYLMSEIAQITKQHHERLDGSGYPAGEVEKGISILAQIIAVSDSFDAMTSERSYRKRRNIEAAYREIADGAGIIYNREFADILTSTPPYYINALFDMHIG